MAVSCRMGRAKVKVTVAVLVMAAVLYLALYSAGVHQMVIPSESVSQNLSWTLTGAFGRGSSAREESRPALTRVHGSRAYILSAVATHRQLSTARYNVVAQVFDGQVGGGGYACCILLNVTSDPGTDVTSSQLYVTRAKLLQQFHHVQILPGLTEYFYPAPFPAKQFLCPVTSPLRPLFLSLAPLVCSRQPSDYVPVLVPSPAQGQLAVCAKVAYNDSLSADWLVEWFEAQRLLGVDKVALYIMSDLPSPVLRVFRHYEAQGLALLVPFDITDEPKRGFSFHQRSFPQFLHDENLPIFDCTERLSGYSFVAGIDTDELIVPSDGTSLKQLLAKELRSHPDAAGFYFYQQFHIRDWGRSDGGIGNLTVEQYQLATPPRWECQKYAYVTKRVDYARTHEFYGQSPYPSYTIDPKVATIHHYRVCPRTWSDCMTMKRVQEPGVLRYKEQLEAAVKATHRRLAGR